MNDNIGNLINGLLTGGILIGKICQALGGGGNSKVYVDEQSGIMVVGDVSAGGVKFFRTINPKTGDSVVYAFNPSTNSPAIVSIPNETDSDGVIYYIAETQKIPFGEADSPQVSPEVSVVAGATSVPKSLSTVEDIAALFKLSFSGLSLGKTVNVGSFNLTCNTNQLTIVSTQIFATAITYLYVKTDKGVTVTNQNLIRPITPPPPNTSNVKQSFAIDFASLGIDLAIDTIEGQITLGVNASNSELAKLSKVPSEQLHPVEREFFARLSKGEL